MKSNVVYGVIENLCMQLRVVCGTMKKIVVYAVMRVYFLIYKIFVVNRVVYSTFEKLSYLLACIYF